MEVSKTSSWPSGDGSIDSVVEVVFDCDGEGASSAQSTGIGNSLLLSPSGDSGPCEITVEFQERLCHVRSIWILSSARTCEVYCRQQHGKSDADYICTARGERWEQEGPIEQPGSQQEDHDEALYEIEVELVNSDAWAGIKLRLLSLVDKALASVRKVAISAAVGPAPGLGPEQEAGTSHSGSSLLSMLLPSVLQVARSMSDSGGRSANASRSMSSSTSLQLVPSTSNNGSDTMQQEPSTTGPGTQEQDFQNEMRHRLQSLEMVCARMESYLHVAFGKLEGRVGHLEEQVGSILNHQNPDPASSPMTGRELAVEPVTPGDITQPLPLGGAVDGEVQSEQVGAVISSDPEGDDVSSASDSTDRVTSARRTSVSLDDAWASALAAFSLCTPTAPAAGLQLDNKASTVDIDGPAGTGSQFSSMMVQAEPSRQSSSASEHGSSDTDDGDLLEEGSLESLEGSTADVLDQVLEVGTGFFDEVLAEAVDVLNDQSDIAPELHTIDQTLSDGRTEVQQCPVGLDSGASNREPFSGNASEQPVHARDEDAELLDGSGGFSSSLVDNAPAQVQLSSNNLIELLANEAYVEKEPAAEVHEERAADGICLVELSGEGANTQLQHGSNTVIELLGTVASGEQATCSSSSNLVELLSTGPSDGDADRVKMNQACSFSGPETDFSSDSLFIDCVDEFLTCQEAAPAPAETVPENEPDLVFLPSFNEQEDAAEPEAVDLLSI